MTRNLDKFFNPYDVLGVEETATKKEIRSAFLRLSKVHHPDKGGNAAEFDKIVRAYTILKDEKTRAQFDKYGIDDHEITVDKAADSTLVAIYDSMLDTPFTLDRIVSEIEQKASRMVGQAKQEQKKLKEVLKKLKGRVKELDRLESAVQLLTHVRGRATECNAMLKKVEFDIVALSRAVEKAEGWVNTLFPTVDSILAGELGEAMQAEESDLWNGTASRQGHRTRRQAEDSMSFFA